MHRFFIDHEIDFREELGTESIHFHQIAHVLRAKIGDRFEFFTPFGRRFIIEIQTIENKKKLYSFRKIDEISEEIQTKRDVRIFFSPIKDKLTLLSLQKATEIGVKEFVPIVCERTQHKIHSISRAREVLREAVEQSGRVVIPRLGDTISLQEALQMATDPIIMDMGGKPFSAIELPQQVDVFIGPEGGWSDREREIFGSTQIMSLSPQTLRAETAIISISSLLLLG
jgi:16S rRNA (uracil1498-N3)-methyltransferase